MTIVSNSNVDYWVKFRWILRFFHCNLKVKRAFGAKNIDEIFTWVDESYVVHYDMKSQAGGAISLV